MAEQEQGKIVSDKYCLRKDVDQQCPKGAWNMKEERTLLVSIKKRLFTVFLSVETVLCLRRKVK